MPPDLLQDASGPSAGRVVVSEGRKFYGASVLFTTLDAVLCLVEEAQIQEAKAAAANEGGTIPKYLVTVYARRAGEDGPPVPFEAVSLTPSLCSDGHLQWYLSGLGPLRQHLGLAPRSPVRLVREVGQDGRVRLVVEPRGEGEGGGGEQGGEHGKGVEEQEGPVEGEGEEGGQGGEGGDTSSGSEDEGSKPGSSNDEGSLDEGSGSDSGSVELDDAPWRPRGGAGQRAGGSKRTQTQRQPQSKQQRQQQHQQQQQPDPPGGSGGDGAGPFGAVAGGPGVVRKGPGGGKEDQQGKRRRLEVRPAQQNGGCKVILNHSGRALLVRTPVSTPAVGLNVSFLDGARAKDTYVHFFTSSG